MMKTIISTHMMPRQTLKLEIWATAKDVSSFSWTVLDILLFGWHVLRGRGNNTTLILELWVPNKIKGGSKDTEVHCLHSLLPLNMAVGKGKWLGECTEWPLCVDW